MNINIEMLKFRLELAELREKEAVRNTTAARTALLMALDGITGDCATITGGVYPDSERPETTGGHYATLEGGGE